MEQPTHSLPSLFKQLGLGDDPTSIDQFIATHSPLKPELHLADAFFWSKSQADFLRARFLMMRIGRRWWISWMCCCARGGFCED
jgi:hypothetical protein